MNGPSPTAVLAATMQEYTVKGLKLETTRTFVAVVS